MSFLDNKKIFSTVQISIGISTGFRKWKKFVTMLLLLSCCFYYPCALSRTEQ